MEKSPESGPPAEDNEENDEFLCAVAAESVNDAILLLREVRAGTSIAMPHLERALTLLVNDGHICVDRAEATGAPGTKDTIVGAGLSPMAIDLIVERRLRDDPMTLEDLSARYNVSRERIRQIEVRAFEKLQNRIRDLARERGMAVPETA